MARLVRYDPIGHRRHQTTQRVRKITYFQMLVSGSVKEAINCHGCKALFHKTAVEELRCRFGHLKHFVKSFISEVQKFPALHLSSPSSFISFSAFLRKLVQTSQRLQFDSDHRSSFLSDTAAAKLPAAYHNKRNEYNITSFTSDVSFRVLSEWMTIYARACENMPEIMKHSDRENVRSKPTTFSVRSKKMLPSLSCTINEEKLQLVKCPDFLKKLVQETINFVRSSNLLFNCLSPRQRVDDCKSTVRCQLTNCGKRHHTSLHRANQ